MFVEECEATNATIETVVGDFYCSDLLLCPLRHHMVEVRHMVEVHTNLISLITPGPIGENKVWYFAIITISCEGFKSSENLKPSILKLLVDHSFSWKNKFFNAARVLGYYKWSPESWKGLNSSYPLRYSPVKELVYSLHLQHLLLAVAKQDDVHATLWPSDVVGKLSWSDGF